MDVEMPLNRAKLQKLADRYIRDAETLHRNRAWSSAYYLAGYAVECALKARIAKEVRKHEFPDLKNTKEAYTHDLERLLGRAGLAEMLAERRKTADGFRNNWEMVVINWNSEVRYDEVTKVMAEELIRAVNDSREGVLPWIKLHW